MEELRDVAGSDVGIELGGVGGEGAFGMAGDEQGDAQQGSEAVGAVAVTCQQPR